MRIYQVYRWDNVYGPMTAFYSTKAEAIREAKQYAAEGGLQCTVQVSVFNLRTRKADVVEALNTIAPTCTYDREATPIAEYETTNEVEWCVHDA